MLIMAFTFIMSTGFAQVSIGISVNLAPPPLPVYVQPPCPTDGYLWQPGYWAYSQDDADYYWVPGVWVAPPRPGVYWTPCYWGFSDGVYGFHQGYWGPHVGFYGGINYGFGYGGVGYGGGEWHNGGFRYNTAVVNVNKTVVHNTYINNTVINNTIVNNHTSFNGQGGVNTVPTPQERAASREQHFQPTSEQLSHQQDARSDKSQFAKANNGMPVAAAMDRVHGTAFNAKGHNAPATPEARQNAMMARTSRNNMPNTTGTQLHNGQVPNHQMQQQRQQYQQHGQQPAQQQTQMQRQQYQQHQPGAQQQQMQQQRMQAHMQQVSQEQRMQHQQAQQHQAQVQRQAHPQQVHERPREAAPRPEREREGHR